MTSSRAYEEYLADTLEAMSKIGRFVDGLTFEEFASDDKTIYAVIRALEVIGEATKRLPQDVRDRYIGVPWREMAGMRDKLIHGYMVVSIPVVWKAATGDIPQIRSIPQAIYDSETS